MDKGAQARHLLLAAAAFGYLALTKVIFGYVIAVVIVLSLAFLVLRRRTGPTATVLSIGVLALILCVPWLLYTHSVTGRAFAWGTGGSSLYWISTPYEMEYGDWQDAATVFGNESLRANHGALYQRLEGRTILEQDAMFVDAAKNNLAQHPAKYLANVACNIGRLVFNYPFSYTAQKPTSFLYIIPNSLLVIPAILAGLGLLWQLFSRNLAADKAAVLGFLVISFGGSALLSASARQLTILVPVLIVLIAQWIHGHGLSVAANWIGRKE